MPIKLIIFDLTGVCYTNEDEAFLPMFCEEHKLDQQRFSDDYFDLMKAAEQGSLSTEEAWQKLLDAYHIDGEVQTIIQQVISYKHPIPELLALVLYLKQKYTIVYFSNYGKEYWQAIQQHLHPDEYFHDGIVSYAIKSRKPQKKGFQLLMKKYKVTPEETIFIDDSLQNVEQAASMNIRAIHFTSREALIQELKKYGVK